MALVPCIFTDEPESHELQRIRRGITFYVAIWSSISLMPFAVARLLWPAHADPFRGFSMLVYGVGALGVNGFAYKYLRQLPRH